MRILQTPARFFPYIGGTEQVVYCLSKELVKRQHHVKIICANEPEAGDGYIEGIEVKRIPYIAKIANTNITISLGRELLKEDFDVLHTHLPHPWSADISGIVAKKKKKPLFLTYHNDITGRGINKLIAVFYNLMALKSLLKQSHKIFLTSENYINYSVILKPFKDKIVVAPLGVDIDKFKPLNSDVKSDASLSAFFLSRLDKFHRYKGLDYLILAIKQVIQKVPLKLYVGGEGELLPYYQDFVKKKGLENSVIFLGKLRDEEVLKNYNACDVFVLPSTTSLQEGFGLVALEAMACKKAVIVSAITGVASDVKKHNAGVVVAPCNINELSEAIYFVLSDQKQRMVMANNAYGLVNSKYTWDKHASIVEQEYLKAI